jgi:predicted oxidoreductase (fatty acid repression mutant protein)
MGEAAKQRQAEIGLWKCQIYILCEVLWESGILKRKPTAENSKHLRSIVANSENADRMWSVIDDVEDFMEKVKAKQYKSIEEDVRTNSAKNGRF